MDKKHILIISFDFPPSASIGGRRISSISKELYQLGFIPHVVTAKIPEQKNSNKLEIPECLVHYVEWFDFWNIKLNLEKFSLTKYIGKLIGYIIPASTIVVPERRLRFWIKPAIKKSLEIINKNDIKLIYSTFNPPANIKIAHVLKKRTGIPWVNEYRDLWTGNPYLTLNKKQYEKNREIEVKLISTSDALITISEPLKRKLSELHNKPTYVIYNGIDQKVNTSFHSIKSGKINIVYAGIIYKDKRDPKPFFLALKMLKENNFSLYSKISVDFYGPGMLKKLGSDLQEAGVADVVKLNEPVSHKEILQIQSNADILLLLGWNNKADEGVMTGKIFEYLGMKKPILALGYEKGAMNMVLEQTNTGKIINEPRQIYEYLLNISNVVKNQKKLKEFKDKIYIDPYYRSNQVKDMINIFSDYMN